ncbi:MAG TPA: GNAT family N-acetyltransferase [Actinomycetota bacterium]|nr:GNAT family N-acetyltransferase [Actinomycetota bacterium]
MIPEGYDVHPIAEEEIAAVARLVYRYDTRDGGEGDMTETALRELLATPRLDRARDTWVASSGGSPVGYGMLWRQHPSPVLLNFNNVDPEHFGRGLGRVLLRRTVARAEEMAAAAATVMKLQTFVSVSDAAARSLVVSEGFQEVRRHYTMAISLRDGVPSYAFPPGFVVRNPERAEAERVHELEEECFAEHWGHVRSGFDEWVDKWRIRSDVDTSLWWIAEKAGEPAGVLLGLIDHDGLSDVAWVASLGVRAPHRGAGLGKALLATAFEEFARRGIPKATLGVDAGNESGAVALYTGIGMQIAHAYITFERSIG